MADELSLLGFQVQQTLHGYGDGHRLLAASASLPAQDTRTMLVLSDISGNGAKLPATGYLTGYPLSESGKYVFARTWPAPEMPRPGCVWTHSLLIDFADLATLWSASSLAALLKRPDGGDLQPAYLKPLNVRPQPPTKFVTTIDAETGAAFIGAIYGKPGAKVVGTFHGPDDENLVLAIWMQQWPRLRRAFRFCTFAAADRSSGYGDFDLQLLGNTERSHRARIADAEIASSAHMNPDLMPLLDDLISPDRDGLRTFLREIGGDVSKGRRAMLPLSRLFRTVSRRSASVADWNTAIESLEELGPAQARAGRKLVSQRALESVEQLDDVTFNFVINNVIPVSGELPDLVADRLGRALWSHDPATFADALREEGPLGRTARHSLGSLTTEQLLEGMSSAPKAAAAIVGFRRDISTNTLFWKLRELDIDEVLAALNPPLEEVTAVIIALVLASRDETADVVVARFGAADTIAAVQAAARLEPLSRLAPWLNVLRGYPADLARALVDGTLRQRELLVLLAHTVGPDDIPNDFGDDPWVVAIDQSVASSDSEAEDFLSAFLMSRALSHRSKSPARLMALSMARAHEALAANRMNWNSWYLIYRNLPWAMPWAEWDRCGRLRQAVVNRFVDSDLDPLQFGLLADDMLLFKSLVDLAAKTGRGRRYLERVRRCLANDNGSSKERDRYIELAVE